MFSRLAHSHIYLRFHLFCQSYISPSISICDGWHERLTSQSSTIDEWKITIGERLSLSTTDRWYILHLPSSLNRPTNINIYGKLPFTYSVYQHFTFIIYYITDPTLSCGQGLLDKSRCLAFSSIVLECVAADMWSHGLTPPASLWLCACCCCWVAILAFPPLDAECHVDNIHRPLGDSF